MFQHEYQQQIGFLNIFISYRTSPFTTSRCYDEALSPRGGFSTRHPGYNQQRNRDYSPTCHQSKPANSGWLVISIVKFQKNVSHELIVLLEVC